MRGKILLGSVIKIYSLIQCGRCMHIHKQMAESFCNPYTKHDLLNAEVYFLYHKLKL